MFIVSWLIRKLFGRNREKKPPLEQLVFHETQITHLVEYKLMKTYLLRLENPSDDVIAFKLLNSWTNCFISVPHFGFIQKHRSFLVAVAVAPVPHYRANLREDRFLSFVFSVVPPSKVDLNPKKFWDWNDANESQQPVREVKVLIVYASQLRSLPKETQA